MHASGSMELPEVFLQGETGAALMLVVGRRRRHSPGGIQFLLQQRSIHPRRMERTLQSAVSAWCSDLVHIPAFRQEA